MKTSIATSLAITALLWVGTARGEVKALRASEMNPKQWSEVLADTNHKYIVEFRKGDELPVSFDVEGDLLETNKSSVSYVGVKKNFWMRLSDNNVEISFDGSSFQDLTKALTGVLQADAKADENGGSANSINILLKAFLRK